MRLLYAFFLLLAAATTGTSVNDDNDTMDHPTTTSARVEERVLNAKMDLWSRGAYDFNSIAAAGSSNAVESLVEALEHQVRLAPLRLGPIRQTRRDTLQQKQQPQSSSSAWWNQWRGGGGAAGADDGDQEVLLQKLGEQFGPEFTKAIEQNKRDHAADCQKSCESFYCAPTDISSRGEESLDDFLGKTETTIVSYSFGPVPPEDFADTFGYVYLNILIGLV